MNSNIFWKLYSKNRITKIVQKKMKNFYISALWVTAICSLYAFCLIQRKFLWLYIHSELPSVCFFKVRMILLFSKINKKFILECIFKANVYCIKWYKVSRQNREIRQLCYSASKPVGCISHHTSKNRFLEYFLSSFSWHWFYSSIPSYHMQRCWVFQIFQNYSWFYWKNGV